MKMRGGTGSPLDYALSLLKKKEDVRFLKFIAYRGTYRNGLSDFAATYLELFRMGQSFSEAELASKLSEKGVVVGKNISTWYTIMSKALYDYWAAEELFRESDSANYFQLRARVKMGGRKYLATALKKAEPKECKGGDAFVLNSAIQEWSYSLALIDRPRSLKNRLEPLSDAVDMAFMYGKLKVACLAENQEQILSPSHPTRKSLSSHAHRLH